MYILERKGKRKAYKVYKMQLKNEYTYNCDNFENSR